MTLATRQTSAPLPAYAATSEAYHRAFRAELRTLVGRLPLRRGQTALDAACGDGFYARLLAERVGAPGRVLAVDLVCNWLSEADDAPASGPTRAIAVQASVSRLPFADDSIDLVWCAHSFRSLPNVRRALKEMVRVARPEGIVAVLENDTLHQVLFPWSARLELAVKSAEFASLGRRAAEQEGYYIGRELVRLLRSSGLIEVVDHAAAFVRQAPLADDSREFFAAHLAALERRASKHLSDEWRSELVELLDDGAWFGRDDFSAVCLERLAWGVKPSFAPPPATD